MSCNRHAGMINKPLTMCPQPGRQSQANNKTFLHPVSLLLYLPANPVLKCKHWKIQAAILLYYS